MAFAAAVVDGALSLGSNISVIGSLKPGATIGVHAGREATLGGAQVMELEDVALAVVDVIDPELASAGAEVAATSDSVELIPKVIGHC